MKKTIYYISGAGRSGSTLFDISLGNLHNTFSLGELIFFVENGIVHNEYCSCGERVPNCSFWGNVIKEWEKTRVLSVQEYLQAQQDLLRNKKTISNIFYYFFPKAQHRQYIKDVTALYEILFEATNHSILVDSSKNAQYILILKKLPFRCKVLHLTRSFSGVLNSSKKELKKNPEDGVERDLIPMRLRYILSIWILDNVLSFLFSLGIDYQRIKYEHLISNPEETIQRIHPLSSNDLIRYKNRGPLQAAHLVAGNKMRMGDDIYIQQPTTLKWEKNISTFQKQMARFVDFFY